MASRALLVGWSRDIVCALKPGSFAKASDRCCLSVHVCERRGPAGPQDGGWVNSKKNVAQWVMVWGSFCMHSLPEFYFFELFVALAAFLPMKDGTFLSLDLEKTAAGPATFMSSEHRWCCCVPFVEQWSLKSRCHCDTAPSQRSCSMHLELCCCSFCCFNVVDKAFEGEFSIRSFASTVMSLRHLVCLRMSLLSLGPLEFV